MLFKTANHSINVDFTEDKLTPFGGLVAFAAFLEELGVVEKLVSSCPVSRSSNNATPIRDIIIGFMLTCILDGKEEPMRMLMDSYVGTSRNTSHLQIKTI